MIYPQRAGGRVTWTTDLGRLIAYAYNLDNSRLSGPVPGSENIYELVATTSDATASDGQIRQMMQTLLADRFKLAAHWDKKEVDGYVLEVAKGGLKLKDAVDGAPPPAMPDWMHGVEEPSVDGKVVATAPSRAVVAVTGRRVTMAQLAGALERQLQTFVTDETGLTGRYYFAFRYARMDQTDDVDAPVIFSALQDLGLKLEKRKGPVQILVIDHIEKTPTEN